MIMNNLKALKPMLILFIGTFIINEHFGKSYEIQDHHGLSLKKSLSQMISSIFNVIKIYNIELGSGNDWENCTTFVKHGLAWECRRTKRAAYLPLSKKANKFITILQEFYGSLQQMQIDEARFNESRGLPINYELIRQIRFLEYGLRNITEMQFRRFITKNIGPITEPYSLGNLPSRPSSGTLKCIRINHYSKLHMLRSCICDILKVKKWMHLMNDNNTKEMLASSDDSIC